MWLLIFHIQTILMIFLAYAKKNKTKVVFATTGFSKEQLDKIEEASKEIAIFQSYNTSFGIQMVTKILRQVAKEFYDNGYDIEILEKHHNQKIDAPSGTAKLLYEVMEDEIQGTTPVYDRSSLHEKRKKEEIGIQALRGASITFLIAFKYVLSWLEKPNFVSLAPTRI